jgi:hypothetical protein
MKIEFSIQQLTKITGLKADDLEELLKGEDGEPLQNAPGIVADKVSERITEIKNAEFNKAKSKTAKAIESIVKSAGVEEFEDVEEAVRKLADKANEKGQSGESLDLSTLTPSQLAKIPAFQAFKETKDAELATLKADYEKTVKAQKAHAVAAKAKEQALSLLTEKNAKFTTPDKQLNALFKLIGTDSLDLDESGNIIVLDEKGEPRIDSHHNKVSFSDLILEEWEPLFGFNAVDPNKKTPQPAAGNNKPTQQSTGIKFDSYEAADKAIRTSNNAKDRMELQKAMNAQFPNGKPK